MADLLLPCPFCGGEAEVCSGMPSPVDSDLVGHPFVRCDECSLVLPGNTKQSAVAAWNLRSLPRPGGEKP